MSDPNAILGNLLAKLGGALTEAGAELLLPTDPPVEEPPTEDPPVVTDPTPVDGWSPRVPPDSSGIYRIATPSDMPDWANVAPGDWLMFMRGKDYPAFTIPIPNVTICADGDPSWPMPTFHAKSDGEGIEVGSGADSVKLLDLDIVGPGSGDGLKLRCVDALVEGCTIRNWTDNIQIENQPSSGKLIFFYRCNNLDPRHEGVMMWPGHHVTFTECIMDGRDSIPGMFDHWLYSKSSSNVSFEHCILARFGGSGWKIRAGIRDGQVSGPSRYWTLHNCLTYRISLPIQLNVESNDQPGDPDDWAFFDMQITDNQLWYPQSGLSAMKLDHVASGVITGNTIFSDGQNPNPAIDLGGVRAEDINIADNRIWSYGVGVRCTATNVDAIVLRRNQILVWAYSGKANPQCLDGRFGEDAAFKENAYLYGGTIPFNMGGVKLTKAQWLADWEPTATFPSMMPPPACPIDDAMLDRLRTRRYGAWVASPLEGGA